MKNNAIVAAVDDMLFAAKIRAVADALKLNVRFAKSAAAVIAAAREVKPSLIIFDLHSQKCDPFATALRLKADDELHGAKLLGFYSHVQKELRRQAEATGFDSVLPRSVFNRRLPDILQGNESNSKPQPNDE